MKKTKKQNKGFRVMSREMQLKICTMGGHAMARDREHMARIGAAGGVASGKSRRSA